MIFGYRSETAQKTRLLEWNNSKILVKVVRCSVSFSFPPLSVIFFSFITYHFSVGFSRCGGTRVCLAAEVPLLTETAIPNYFFFFLFADVD
jgi:hypothetical protein